MTTVTASPPQTPPPKSTSRNTVPTVVGTPPLPAFSIQSSELYRLSVEQYRSMIQEGILTKYDKVELLEGILVQKMPRNPPHDGTLDLLEEMIRRLGLAGWLTRTQRAIVLADSQPEPDVAFVRGDSRSYLTRHPNASDIGLLVEVADSTLSRDRGEKLRIYARAGVVEYWIVNLVDKCIEVHTQPSGPSAAPEYGIVKTYQAGQSIPFVLDGVAIANIPVADLLP